MNTTITALIGLVSALLLQAQSPALTPAAKIDTYNTAQQVLLVLERDLATPQTTTPVVTQVSTTPTQVISPVTTVIQTQPKTTTSTQPVLTVTVLPPESTSVPQAPSLACSLSATTTSDPTYWVNNYGTRPPTTGHAIPVQFTWSFTQGATGIITGGPSQDVLGQTNNSDSAIQIQIMPYAAPASETTYTLTVTEDGASTSCDTTVN